MKRNESRSNIYLSSSLMEVLVPLYMYIILIIASNILMMVCRALNGARVGADTLLELKLLAV